MMGKETKMAAIRKFEFTPVLGWSASRYDMFSVCKRRYYYTYYGQYDRTLPAGFVRKYKELVSISLETGGIVHEVIGFLLRRLSKATDELDRAKFFDFARRKTEHHLRTHKFQEIVYGERSVIEVDNVFPKVKACLENLITSDRYNWLVNVAAPTSSEWIIDQSGYGETRLEDMKIYCKVDFLFPINGEFHIIDWKTGKPEPEKHRRQMIGYAAWACHHLEIGPEIVAPVLAYLHPSYQEVRETFNHFDLEDFAILVRAGTEEMYSYCADCGQNVPLGIEYFPLRNDPRVCLSCNFRGMCHPDEYCAKLL